MLKRLLAAMVAVVFLLCTVTVAPDGTVEVGVAEAAHAQTVDEEVDPNVALLLSLLVPGILQFLWTDEASTGLVYLLVAVLGYVAVGIIFSIVFRAAFGYFFLWDLAYLIAVLFYLGVGYFAYKAAKPKMYGGAGDSGGGGSGMDSYPMQGATLPIANEPLILYNGAPVPAY